MLNRATLVGRLTKDPDLRYTPAGKPVVTFTLAVKRIFKNSEGNYETDFINIVQWNGAENTANYLKKGSLAGVDGRIATRNFEGQDGRRIYVTEVVAESVQFLDSKGKGQGEQPKPQKQASVQSVDPFEVSGQIDISDDDLPF